MIILKNTTDPQDVMIQRPNPDNDIQRNAYLKSSDLKTLNNESLVGTGNISIPVVTKTSQLINDSGFIGTEGLDAYALKTDIPTKTSQLTNDSGYLTEHQSLDEYYTKGQVDTKFGDYYNKSEVDEKIAESGTFDPTQYYTKTDTDTLLGKKADQDYVDNIKNAVDVLHSDTVANTEAIKTKADKTDIPTKTSQLTNDSGYIDSTALDGYAKTSDVNTELEKKADKSSIPTKTSDLTNDSDYTTKQYVDSSISTALGTVENKLSLI